MIYRRVGDSSNVCLCVPIAFAVFAIFHLSILVRIRAQRI
jgi:hypothetical protein